MNLVEGYGVVWQDNGLCSSCALAALGHGETRCRLLQRKLRAVCHQNDCLLTLELTFQNPLTVTGTELFVVVPSPSMPPLLFPKHWTEPLLSTTQVELIEAPTAMALVMPETVTGTVLDVPEEPKLPSR